MQEDRHRAGTLAAKTPRLQDDKVRCYRLPDLQDPATNQNTPVCMRVRISATGSVSRSKGWKGRSFCILWHSAVVPRCAWPVVTCTGKSRVGFVLRKKMLDPSPVRHGASLRGMQRNRTDLVVLHGETFCTSCNGTDHRSGDCECHCARRALFFNCCEARLEL